MSGILRENKAFIKDLHVTNQITTPDGSNFDGTDVAFLADVVAGTAAASKALVLDASSEIATIASLTATALVGDLTGDVTGAVQHTVTVYDDTGAIAIAPGIVILSKGTAAAMTLAAPTATTHDGIVMTIVSITAAAHTVTATTIGFNAGDAASDVGTFGGAIGDGLTILAYQGEWYVLNNINVTLA